jgi:hypothetical protein
LLGRGGPASGATIAASPRKATPGTLSATAAGGGSPSELAFRRKTAFSRAFGGGNSLFLARRACEGAAATRAPFHMSDRLQCTLDAIDGANARDPNKEAGEPAELVYGRRMSKALAVFAPGASEALEIAVRGQHIERWLTPRGAYPDGRSGYIAWRNAAKRSHAERVAEIMGACGYDEWSSGRASALVRKEQLRSDVEAQTLEDVACLVFLRHYAASFALKHPEAKVLDILVRTQRKMSARARGAALDFGLPTPVLALYDRGLRTFYGPAAR